MGHQSCCVVNCKNTGLNSKCSFYKFPTLKWKIPQRIKWIAAVRRINPDGSPWKPKPSDVICSDHFINGKKSDEVLNPSYIPTIFPAIYKNKIINEKTANNRHIRYMQRRSKKMNSVMSSNCTVNNSIKDKFKTEVQCNVNGTKKDNEINTAYKEQSCQANIFINNRESSKTFICNRYINNSVCDAEIQTDINNIVKVIVIPNQKQFKNKASNTSKVETLDESTQSNTADNVTENKGFCGFSSVNNDSRLLNLAGVTLENFNFLLSLISKSSTKKISMENRLLIFLIKIKCGLTFSAISVLFRVHRSIVSSIFFSILKELTFATSNLVFWPSKDVVQRTMPESFKPKYSNTRVIIDCTEFQIENQLSVENRVFCYSNYKKGFTAKVLIGITPSGFISFKSKVFGDRKSDSLITIESGLLDLLEDGDEILADKGFPEVCTHISQSGKKIMMVMAPFLEKKEKISKTETEDTYTVAKVRIHVEKIKQRIRAYNILNKIPATLFHCFDDILHICCVLVNLQPLILNHRIESEE